MEIPKAIKWVHLILNVNLSRRLISWRWKPGGQRATWPLRGVRGFSLTPRPPGACAGGFGPLSSRPPGCWGCLGAACFLLASNSGRHRAR